MFDEKLMKSSNKEVTAACEVLKSKFGSSSMVEALGSLTGLQQQAALMLMNLLMPVLQVQVDAIPDGYYEYYQPACARISAPLGEQFVQVSGAIENGRYICDAWSWARAPSVSF